MASTGTHASSDQQRTPTSRAHATWRDVTWVRHLLLAAIGLVVVIVVLTVADDYQSTRLTEMAYLAMAAAGLTVLTGINGQISLGHGALMAFGAYTTALLLPNPDSGTPVLLVIVISVLVTLLVGIVIGVAAARLHGPYLAGATLALAVAVPGIARHFQDTLGGDQGLRSNTPDIPGWATDVAFFITGSDPGPSKYVAFLAWCALIVTFLLLANLARSRVGRRWAAVRDDEVAAELAGIDLGRARVSAFAVSAAAAGAAGSILALAKGGAAPGSFNLTLSLTLLTAVVIGGLGSLAGALFGAALLTFLPQYVADLGRAGGMSDIAAAELAPLVYGVVMVLVILFAPRGLAGAVRAGNARLRARRRTRARAAADSGSTDGGDGSSRTGPSETPTDPDEHTGSTNPAGSTEATTRKGTP